MNSSTQTENVAAAWLAKRDSGEWNAEDDAQLTAWLDASFVNRVSYLRLQAAWQEADRLRALGAGVERFRVPERAEWDARTLAADREPVTQSRDRGRVLRLGALAAGFILAIAWAVGHYLWVPAPVLHQTAVGGIKAVSLEEGSNITLGTDTALRIAMSGTQRRVDLEQGEAFFEVQRDRFRPFVVAAGSLHVRALGTKFSVRRVDGVLQVVVAEGRVRLESAQGDVASFPSTELTPGSIARSDGQSVFVQQVPQAQLEDYLSWREGFLVFKDMRLADAVQEFNRYHESPKMIILDPAIADTHIGGRYRSTNVDGFVQVLETMFGVRAQREGDDIVLRSP